MYWPDTNTGVDIEPARKPVASLVRQYFSEGGVGQAPTVPGGDFFNQITNELLNVVTAAGLEPSKTEDDQLLQAIEKLQAKKMQSYTALRNYTGRATTVRITAIGLAGFFEYDSSDTTSADNGGTIIVSSDGRRWKRQYSGLPSVAWWGAKADWNGTTGTDNTAALQAAHNAYAVLFYPEGAYKSGSINFTKFGTTLVGPGSRYGVSEIVYTGTGTFFTCNASVSFVQFKAGIYLHGIPSVSTDYYNAGSVALDTTAGNTSFVFDDSWINGFEIPFNGNYNSYYNRINGSRIERFKICLNKFSINNLLITGTRFSRFNVAFVVNGANGPIVMDGNSFEIFNGQICDFTGVERGEAVFTNNYVELYDSLDLPTNFPPSNLPNVDKFGGNILFTGPVGSFISHGNDLQIGGCFRFFSSTTVVDFIQSIGNNIHVFDSGNNLERMWTTPGVLSCDINDRLGVTQGAGPYSRAYNQTALAHNDPNRQYYFYDCVAGKAFRPAGETAALTLLNGWTSPDANHGIARVHKKDGVVRLSGVVDGTSRTDIVIFTIPVAYRPDEINTTRAYANFSCFSAYGGGTVVRLRYFYATGELRMEGSPVSAATIPLDSIVIPVRI